MAIFFPRVERNIFESRTMRDFSLKSLRFFNHERCSLGKNENARNGLLSDYTRGFTYISENSSGKPLSRSTVFSNSSTRDVKTLSCSSISCISSRGAVPYVLR